MEKETQRTGKQSELAMIGERVSLVIDPSPFMSKKRLRDLLKILDMQPFVKKRIILPKPLFVGLTSLVKGGKPEAREELIGVFRFWLPFYPIEHVQIIVKGLAEDREYVAMLTAFLLKTSPYSGGDKIGGDSIYLREIIERLRNSTVGQIVFEILAASQRGAWIISFGEKTINLVRRVGVHVLIAPSRLKQSIRANLRIRRNLRISTWGLTTVGLVSDFARSFGLATHLPPGLGVTQFGIMVVADG